MEVDHHSCYAHDDLASDRTIRIPNLAISRSSCKVVEVAVGMAESEKQGENSKMNTKQGGSGKERELESLGKAQEIKKYKGQVINDMKVSELKDALRKLDVSAIGNKNELRIKLRDALARKRHSEAAGGKEVMTDNADTTSGEDQMSEDDATSDGEDAEDSRKKQHESTKQSHRSRRAKYTTPRNEKGQRIETKHGKQVRPKGEPDETDETSDFDTSVERENDEVDHRIHREARRLHSKFTIKDVEGSLTHFTGDDKLPIKKWITEFEDVSDLLHWSELQKLIYGKRMLKGSAKRFISFEKDVTSWSILKRKLKKEFKIKLNSALIHSQLYKRRRQSGESSRQYIYAMQEIAEQGYIEEEALVQYIVDGLPDEDNNKTSLYEAGTISELKKKLEVYDRLKERTQKKKTLMKKDTSKTGIKDTKKETKANVKSSDKKRCFNCGSPEHDVKNCADADKGPKCFK